MIDPIVYLKFFASTGSSFVSYVQIENIYVLLLESSILQYHYDSVSYIARRQRSGLFDLISLRHSFLNSPIPGHGGCSTVL